MSIIERLSRTATTAERAEAHLEVAEDEERARRKRMLGRKLDLLQSYGEMRRASQAKAEDEWQDRVAAERKNLAERWGKDIAARLNPFGSVVAFSIFGGYGYIAFQAGDWDRLMAMRKRAERLGLNPAGRSAGEPGKFNCSSVKQLARKATAPVVLVDPTDVELEEFARRARSSRGGVL